MPLIDFWCQHARQGVHPQDVPFVSADKCLHLTSIAEARRQQVLEKEEGVQSRKLHTGLFPQPFAGNIRQASAYILFGNPGFSFMDYQDEYSNPKYAALCAASLLGAHTGFAPLHEDSQATGAGKYWRSTLRRLMLEIDERPGAEEGDGQRLVESRLAVIESGAYHSHKFPRDGFHRHPSAQAAREFVHSHVLPRAFRGECVVLVWRNADFWGLEEIKGMVKIRAPSFAFGRYLLEAERKFLGEMLLARQS